MSALEVHTPVRFIRGIGPKKGQVLQQAGIETVLDLLHIRPTRYELHPYCKPIGEWRDGEQATIAGEILNVRPGRSGSGPSITLKVSDGSDRCRIVWFNTPYLRSSFSRGQYLTATGKITYTDQGAQIINPKFRLFDTESSIIPEEESLQPVYPSTAGLSSSEISRTIAECRSQLRWPGDYLDPSVRLKRRLPELSQAIRQLHEPDSLQAAECARRRLAYDELVIAQLNFEQEKSKRSASTNAPILHTTAEIDARIRKRLPFDLTGAQNRAVEDIVSDLSRNQSMFRLLQGEVGSGKTAVAVYAALVAIANKHQVALLAPTEMLAHQHYDKMSSYLNGSAVRVALARGGLADAERKAIRDALATGEINLVVGTHALLAPEVRLRRLGLVIIDEQQRFGVRQRQMLQKKAISPHYLVLSATPIPRTQALYLYGDLDLSIIDALPSKARTVATCLVPEDHAARAWTIVRSELDRGRQAYIIFPIIDESERMPLKALNAEFQRLSSGELSAYRCAALHGRLAPSEQEKVIDAFRAGDIQVVVSTTVVEVGLDIPNATTMVVYHAERYGLAQLHQLRGRIGRSGRAGCFILLADPHGEPGWKRLRILEQTSDGFEIAEADLKLRGPGALMGTRQHGVPKYKFADLFQDVDLLYAAREDAQAILNGRLSLNRESRSLLEAFQKHYGQSPGSLIHVA